MALLRCAFLRYVAAFRGTPTRSAGEGEVVEGGAEPVGRRGVSGDVIVAAAAGTQPCRQRGLRLPSVRLGTCHMA
jgi:hypothetical protein